MIKTLKEIAEAYTNKVLNYDSTPENPSEIYEWIRDSYIAGNQKKDVEEVIEEPVVENRELFKYSNYELISSHSIRTDTYKGDYKTCVKDTDEEISSKPFTIDLIYSKIDGEEILLDHELVKGDFTYQETLEIIESLK